MNKGVKTIANISTITPTTPAAISMYIQAIINNKVILNDNYNNMYIRNPELLVGVTVEEGITVEVGVI